MPTVGGNFIGQDTPSVVDTQYERCNFSCSQPVDSGGGVYVGVRLFPGDNTPRTFIECNLGNREPPPGSTLTRCNVTLRRTNIVSSTETVTINGESVQVDHHVHIVLGKWTAGGYEYLPAPVNLEVD